MAENTKIEWAHHTFNPWEGCQKVGPGCDHCYAEARNARFAGGQAVNWGPGAPRRRTSASNWQQPIKWNAEAERMGIRYRVFCASLADVFDNEVDPQWRDDLFDLIAKTPNLDWLLLTKRIGNVGNMLPVPFDFDRLYPNVLIGATIVNQAEADRDIPKLLQVPAAKRFLSMEPLLGPVDLTRIPMRDTCASECCGNWRLDVLKGASYCGEAERDPRDEIDEAESRIDWVIVGGESGHHARPMHPDWARSLRDQCQAAGVPFLFKQWGEHDLNYDRDRDDPDYRRCDKMAKLPGRWINLAGGHGFNGERVHYAHRVGKKAAGRLLDGVTHDGFPA